MSPHPHSHLVFIGAFLMLVANAAMAEIVKCTNSTGAVTFRDVPCKAGEDAVRIYGPSGHPQTNFKPVMAIKRPSEVEHARTVAKIDRPPVNYGLSTDVATLKAARETLVTRDRLSKLTHQPTFASRD